MKKILRSAYREKETKIKNINEEFCKRRKKYISKLKI